MPISLKWRRKAFKSTRRAVREHDGASLPPGSRPSAAERTAVSAAAPLHEVAAASARMQGFTCAQRERVDAMKLKGILRQIKPNALHSRHRWTSPWIALLEMLLRDKHHPGALDAVGAPSSPSPKRDRAFRAGSDSFIHRRAAVLQAAA
jgi:hypothetical protein